MRLHGQSRMPRPSRRSCSSRMSCTRSSASSSNRRHWNSAVDRRGVSAGFRTPTRRRRGRRDRGCGARSHLPGVAPAARPHDACSGHLPAPSRVPRPMMSAPTTEMPPVVLMVPPAIVTWPAVRTAVPAWPLELVIVRELLPIARMAPPLFRMSAIAAWPLLVFGNRPPGRKRPAPRRQPGRPVRQRIHRRGRQVPECRLVGRREWRGRHVIVRHRYVPVRLQSESADQRIDEFIKRAQTFVFLGHPGTLQYLCPGHHLSEHSWTPDAGV